MVAPWWQEPCPSCLQVKLGSFSQSGVLLPSILTGRFLGEVHEPSRDLHKVALALITGLNAAIAERFSLRENIAQKYGNRAPGQNMAIR
jgi:hypothetical protein